MFAGYGGFNVTLSPAFSPAIQGGWRWAACMPVANLRGGGEYGEEWHPGRHEAAQAERVRRLHRGSGISIREKYTNTKRLAILGRSNGGLLIGAR